MSTGVEPPEHDHGNVEPRELADEMRASYLDYAMSVIVGRALPDVRDGLKPVHRRVLYAMQELGLQPNRPYVKCAKVVGETMGSYHPHGDSAIYDTLVRLAQDFSIRQLLVDGQGNFGNVDGYPAAAMRYTECRLAPAAVQMLRDLDADTVDFMPNYDGSKQQPVVLPTRFPNLLVNGSSGIAVGMATNIPPHNLAEAIDATVAMIDDPEIDVEGLMQHLKGPDFPTGGIIMGLGPIREAYETGRGRIRVRARTDVEELAGGRTAIIVTELPYTIKKGGEDGVIVKIAQLVRDKVITEIHDIQDQSSDKGGMRLVIELKRDAVVTVVLNKLFKHTQLQTTFGVNMVALVDNVPRTLGLRDVLRHYIAHQKDVVTRRTKFQLARAEARAHILKGYLIALENLDAVIALIRVAPNPDAARHGLMDAFGLSEEQAQAILDLRLQRLTNLGQDEIKTEHARLVELIAELRSILADERRVFELIKEELAEVRAQFADERRTEIRAAGGDIDIEALIPDEDVLIAVTSTGYVKRMPIDAYRAQRRGGVGVRGMKTKDDDWIEHIFVASSHDYILFITSVGKIYRVKAWELPEGGAQSKGRALINTLPLQEGERVKSVFRTRDYSEGRYLVFGTRKGIIKKTEFLAYNTHLRTDGIIALRIDDDDELVDVRLADEGQRIMMVSRMGQAVLFDESEARSLGRATRGVTGMRLRSGDEVIALRVPQEGDDLLVVTEQGIGKRTPVDEYRQTRRGSLGVLTQKITDKSGPLAGAVCVSDEQQIMLITQGGIVTRQSVDEIRQAGRNTQGVIVQRVREDDRIAALAVVPPDEGDELDDELEAGAEGPGETGGDAAGAAEAPAPSADAAAEPAAEPDAE